MVREYRLGVLIALVVMAWSANAHASYTLANLTAPPTQNMVESATVTASLSTTDSGNPHVDLVIDMNNCPTNTGTGTFNLSPTNNIPLMNPQTISLSYTPATPGTLTCKAYIYDHGTTTQLGTFNVSGNGQRPPTISGSAPGTFTAVRFNDNAVAQKTSTKTINISNTGERQLNITGVTIDNQGENNFALTGGFTTDNIAAAGSKSWTVTFDPLTGGTKNATITFASNDPATPNLVLGLQGTGTSGNLSLAQTGAFGNVPGGSVGTVDIAMSNIGGGTKGTLSVTGAMIMGATQNWFAISACNSATCNFSSAPIQFTSSTPNLQVRCSPPAGTVNNTPASATLMVTADNDPNATPVATVPLTCNAIASELAFMGGINSLDFGKVLLNTTSAPQTVTLTNTGSVTANNFTIAPQGSSAGLFSFTGTKNGAPCNGSGCNLSTNDQLLISVTFTPTVEGFAGAQVNLTNSSSVMPAFLVNGKGVDKKLGRPDVVDFPDTFRNPGSKAPIVPVTLMNTGEYDLTITELNLDGGGVYELVDPTTPIVIPGLTSHDVMVKFAPLSAEKAPEGLLSVINNSANDTMPLIRLAGNGKARNVDMSPASVDVGETFAGVPALLSVTRPGDVLKVANMEIGDDGDFTIREIKITGDGADMFEVQELGGGSLSGRGLARGEMVSVDVVFKPTYVGLFDATLELYLDEDTSPQTPVPIHGNALWVDAHGSGGFGCSTGRGSRGAMLLVMGVLLLVLRRRRR